MTINIKEIFKTMLFSLIPASYFIWTQQMHCALFTLVIITILDLFSGIFKAAWLGVFHTKIAWDKSLVKLFRLTMVIALSYFIDVGIGHNGGGWYSVLQGAFIATCFFYAAIECLSILENIEDTGFPVPTGFITFFRRNIKKPVIK